MPWAALRQRFDRSRRVWQPLAGKELTASSFILCCHRFMYGPTWIGRALATGRWHPFQA